MSDLVLSEPKGDVQLLPGVTGRLRFKDASFHHPAPALHAALTSRRNCA